tara:strand:+ start:856 stop:2217 length:1362 start_codon:yes stop_codon:yes gene_type:complete
MSKDIYLTNSYSNKKEKFIPINSKKIGMYVCGPTVYDDPHIGNARPLVIFDILFKLLKFKFNESIVTYIRNITDVDDKIIAFSKEKKISIFELTKKITNNFNDDCEYLFCEKPTHEPRATDNIDVMIKMISDLILKGYAYEKNNHVYFEVKKFKDYGKLSNRNLEDLVAGSRVEVSENKKNPSDFVLWKPSVEDEHSWESPWGKGRPGWHLECSAMSKKYLDVEFDIHGGGRDLIFPHHENEIAQSICANETKFFAKYWLHNGFITMSNEKMAKSQGNILKIKDFKKKTSGQVLRLALINAHYRQPLDWNDELIRNCQNTIEKWYSVYKKLDQKNSIPHEIIEPLLDDINTPRYITKLHELYSKAVNGKDEDIKLFNQACNFIGLLSEDYDKWNSYKKVNVNISEKEILDKIKQRNIARKEKNFKLADRIRNELFENGILIEDKDDTTSWKYK